MKKTAIILFNLGGPDQPSAIRPFLQNLFTDPAIIDLPALLRLPLAWWIAKKRAPEAAKIYAELGGKSPILKNTKAQAAALQKKVKNSRVFICMRYWHPMIDQTIRDVEKYKPDRIILLPLYPQFSTTTTASSFDQWHQHAAQSDLKNTQTQIVGCYFDHPGFITAQADLIKPHYKAAQKHGRPRILFSAHGLPERTVAKRNDPYVWQIQQGAAAIAKQLNIKNLDWRVTFQSRVGKLEWVKPYTENEIIAAGHQNRPLVVVPIAFVSEHSETLVELDIEYKELAEKSGVPHYERVPTTATHPKFIAGLADIVNKTLNQTDDTLCWGSKTCPKNQRSHPCPTHCKHARP